MDSVIATEPITVVSNNGNSFYLCIVTLLRNAPVLSHIRIDYFFSWRRSAVTIFPRSRSQVPPLVSLTERVHFSPLESTFLAGISFTRRTYQLHCTKIHSAGHDRLHIHRSPTENSATDFSTI